MGKAGTEAGPQGRPRVDSWAAVAVSAVGVQLGKKKKTPPIGYHAIPAWATPQARELEAQSQSLSHYRCCARAIE